MQYNPKQVNKIYTKGYHNGFKDGLEFALLFPDDVIDVLEMSNGR